MATNSEFSKASPSLSDMAQTHLKTQSVAPSLSDFANMHFQLTSGVTGTPSLTDLAQMHLQTTPCIPQLFPQADPSLQMGSAASPLQPSKPAADQFHIPDLFGQKSTASCAASSTDTAIDLTSALMSRAKPSDEKESADSLALINTSKPKPAKGQLSHLSTSVIDELIRRLDSIDLSASRTSTAAPSAFGLVLCSRSDDTKVSKPTFAPIVQRRNSKVVPFSFNVASPDDIVFNAQMNSSLR